MSDLFRSPYAPLLGRVAWRTADGCVLVLRVGARPGFCVGTSSLHAVRPRRYRERRRLAALGRMLAGARRIERLRRRASGRVYLVFRGRYSPREWDVVARPTGRCRAEIITVRRVGVVAPVDRAGELGEDEGKFGAITRALGSWLWGSPSTAAAQAATRMLSSASGGGTTAHSVRVIWLEPCRLDLCLHKHRNVLYLLVRTGGARKVPIYVCSETSEASKRMNEYSRASIFSGSIPWVSRRTSGT